MKQDTEADIQSDVSADELLRAVKQFLRERAIPALSGRDQFNARVAANVLGIIEREQALRPELTMLDKDAAEKWLPRGAAEQDVGVEIARALANRQIATDELFVNYLKARQLLVTAINNPRYPSRMIAERRWRNSVDGG